MCMYLDDMKINIRHYFRFILFLSLVTLVTSMVLIKLGYVGTERFRLRQAPTPTALWIFNSSFENKNLNRSRLNSVLQVNSNQTVNSRDQKLFVEVKNKTNNSLESILESSYSEKNISEETQVSEINLKSYSEGKYFFKRRKPITIVNCRAIFDGNQREISRAEKLSYGYLEAVYTALDYIRLTQNCEKFIQDRGYITESLNKDEENFPIAYSILMFKAVHQTEKLLRAIYRPQNVYCIHVDAKANDNIFQALSGIASCFDNVFTCERIEVTWGLSSVLVPEIMCMKELTKRNKNWKYFINLTGQEFPLRTNAELVAILKAYNGTNDVDTYVAQDSEQKRRITIAGEAPHGVVPMKGRVHVAVTRDFVNYVISDQKAKDILKWSLRTEFSEELFFPTLQGNPILNVPGGYSENRPHSIRPAARFKVWRGNGVCRGKFMREICIFGVGDLSVLGSRYEMFANKFRMSFYPLAYDCLEEYHYNRTRDQYFGKLTVDVSGYRDGGFVAKGNRIMF